MNWEAIGALGEIFGALVVAITVIFLTVQLRKNTKATKSAIYQSYVTFALDIADYVSTNVDLIVKAGSGGELTKAESVKLDMFAAKLFYQMEAIYLHQQEGSINAEIFNSRMRGFKAQFERPHLVESWDFLSTMDMSSMLNRT